MRLSSDLLVPLIAFGVLAATGITGMALKMRRVLATAKPAATLVLIAVAAPRAETLSILVTAGLILSAAGDAALLKDDSRRFLIALGLFAVAHVLYAAAFLPMGALWAEGSLTWLVTPLVIFSSLSAGLVTALWARAGSLRGPVVLYACLITFMVLTAVATLEGSMSPRAAEVAAVGACLFYASDALLGWRQFRTAFPGSQEVTLGLYWAGQLGIALAARWA